MPIHETVHVSFVLYIVFLALVYASRTDCTYLSGTRHPAIDLPLPVHYILPAAHSLVLPNSFRRQQPHL
jgi:hypothetical protein